MCHVVRFAAVPTTTSTDGLDYVLFISVTRILGYFPGLREAIAFPVVQPPASRSYTCPDGWPGAQSDSRPLPSLRPYFEAI
jgi:hypothetical protein